MKKNWNPEQFCSAYTLIQRSGANITHHQDHDVVHQRDIMLKSQCAQRPYIKQVVSNVIHVHSVITTSQKKTSLLQCWGCIKMIPTLEYLITVQHLLHYGELDFIWLAKKDNLMLLN